MQVAGGCCLAIIGLVLALVLSWLFLVGPLKADAATYRYDSRVAKQHQSDACVLAAMATSMNFKSNGVNYTSAGLALAYKLKYHRTDWAKDGNTSHQAQTLAEDAGFSVQYGKMNADNGGVEALKYLAWSHQYPVVFLAGSPQHAITVIGMVNQSTLQVADPFTGLITEVSPQDLYNQLESEHWFVSLK